MRDRFAPVTDPEIFAVDAIRMRIVVKPDVAVEEFRARVAAALIREMHLAKRVWAVPLFQAVVAAGTSLRIHVPLVPDLVRHSLRHQSKGSRRPQPPLTLVVISRTVRNHVSGRSGRSRAKHPSNRRSLSSSRPCAVMNAGQENSRLIVAPRRGVDMIGSADRKPDRIRVRVLVAEPDADA